MKANPHLSEKMNEDFLHLNKLEMNKRNWKIITPNVLNLDSF